MLETLVVFTFRREQEHLEQCVATQVVLPLQLANHCQGKGMLNLAKSLFKLEIVAKILEVLVVVYS